MIEPKIVLRRAALSGCVVSAYDVLVDGVLIGQVVRDEIEPSEPGAARHLWHAYLDGDDEACGSRCFLRRDAVDELMDEWRWANRPRESS